VKPDPIGKFPESYEVVQEDKDEPESAFNVDLLRIDIKRYGYTAFLHYKI
jgi:hypothetical protein